MKCAFFRRKGSKDVRIILLGGGSFIGSAVAKACQQTGKEYLALSHTQSPLGIGPGDCLINFALDPMYRDGPYDETRDRDLAAARVAAKHRTRFVMLSTRRVYGPEDRWNVKETAPATGDETSYGRNKAITEIAVRRVCGDRAAIFRLSNIFGYEYSKDRPRHSFLGMLLTSLRSENTIRFDVHSDTRRDFLPVDICARALVARALDGTSGTFNLGAGFPIACGSLAQWVMEGLGSGKLICDPPVVREEFYLNMDKWRARFGPVTSEDEMRDYCIGIGRTLRCEKS